MQFVASDDESVSDSLGGVTRRNNVRFVR